MTVPQSLIFDLDGTLIDSSVGVAEAVNYSLERTGHQPKPLSEIAPYIGYPLKQMYHEFGVGPFDDLYAFFQERAATSVIAAAEPLPGVNRVLEFLANQGHGMAVATTKVRRHVDQIVAKLGWTEYFDVLVGGDDVAMPKPDPAAFQLAMNRLGSLPSQTIVVGDTVNDVIAAQKLSLCMVAVRSPYGNNDKLEASNPHYVIDTLAALPDLLQSLQERKEAI